ncbi:nucleotidyltransferase [Synergistales bacterium]|nr:nucleotidyltransferase [Synergistales bacterium]
MANAVGIIAEYNPLHRGHEFHIAESRRRAGGAPVIAAVSSNFVQRGAPALARKDVRAAMALSCGVDLVLELPFVFSSHNGGVFANAAVDILAATGQVGFLSFGMETPDVAALERLAAILADEPEDFKRLLKDFLRLGYSFVQARSMALDEITGGAGEAINLLKQPNNNLALAYVKRLREKQYNIVPRAIERVGAGHNDTRGAGSATAIRELLSNRKPEEAYSLMPSRCAEILRDETDKGRAVYGQDRLWRAVKQALISGGTRRAADISEMREGLENRLIEAAYRAGSFDEFTDMCASRRYPKGRIRRHAIHILTGLNHADGRTVQASGPTYIKALGMNGRGRELLAAMRESAALPVITRSSPPRDETGVSELIARKERAATEIWETLTDNPRARAETMMKPVIRE